MKTIIVMKWGTKYSNQHVNILYENLNRVMPKPWRMVCIGDDPSGLNKSIDFQELHDPYANSPIKPILIKNKLGNYLKLELMNARRYDLDGDVLFLDLDLVPITDMAAFFDYPGKFIIIEDWVEKRKKHFSNQKNYGNSSVFRHHFGDYQNIYDNFHKNPIQMSKDYSREQTYLSSQIPENDIVFWPEAWCQSFKRHCMQPFPLNYLFDAKMPPSDCKILVFHGHPLPEEAANGYQKNMFRRTKPVGWLRDYV
jgi:hypothetical protein